MCRKKSAATAVVAALLVCLALAGCGQDEATPTPASPNTPTLILYSSLSDERVAAITEAYTQSSGVPMHYMFESAAVLIEKMRTKAHRPSADLLLISGSGQLVAAAESGVLRPTTAQTLLQSIPAKMRDPDGYWFGMSVRAVAVVYDRRSIEPVELSGYSSLADEKWLGGLCLLSSGQESSRMLVASLIAILGKREAELVVRRWQKNLAVPVFSTGGG